MQLLEAVKVSKNFGGLNAISNVNFELKQGEILGLIGPNGAGKTTLFNLISGAYKPKSGVIKFKEHSINGMQPNKICRLGIARTFQLLKK
jgi:branched-chain amino acid transport system ATP-binding protein